MKKSKKSRFSRKWLFGLGVLSLIYLLALLQLQLNRPADGYADLDGLLHGSITAGQPLTAEQTGLQVDDVVLAINEQSIAQLRQWTFTFTKPPEPLQIGQPAVYTVLRRGQQLNVSVVPTQLTVKDMLKKWPVSLVSGVIFLLIGVAVVLLKPKERIAQVFYLASLGLSLSMFGQAIFASQASDLVNQTPILFFAVLEFFTFWLNFPLILHLLLIFPRKSKLLTKAPWLLPVTYPALMVLSLTIGFVQGDNLSTSLAATNQVRFPIAVVYLVTGMGNLFYAFFTGRDRTERNQLRWIVWGIGVGATPWLFLFVLPTIIFGSGWISIDFANLFLILVPLAFGFSIIKYHLFDIETLIHRSLIYGLLSAVLAGVYLLLVALLTPLIPYLGVDTDSPIVPIVAVIVVAVIFAPAKNRLQSVIDRIFYQERSIFNRLPIEVSRELSGEVKLPSIITLLTETIPTRLKISAVELLLADHSRQKWISYQDLNGKPANAPIANDLIALFKKQGRAVALYDAEQLPQQLHAFFEQGIEVIIPLFVENRLVGLYNFYAKYSGDYYNSEEVEILNNLGYQAGVSISNALSFQRIEQLNLDLESKAREYETLYRQERRRAIQLGLISEVSREISSILEIDRLLDTVVQLIRASFDYDWVSISLIEQKRESGVKILTCVASSGNFAEKGSPVGTQSLLSDPGVNLRVARTGQPALVKDVTQDVDYVALPGFEGAASELTVPLSTQEGVVGVLDLVSRRLNAFDIDDLTTMQSLAGQIAVAIENAHLYQTQAKQERLKQELLIAYNIQANLLPQKSPATPGLNIYGYSIPAQEVGGDFFNYVRKGDKNLGVAVGDISGKGLPASLFMAVSITALRAQAPHYQNASSLLESLNVLLYPQLRANRMNAAVLYAQFDLEKNLFLVSNAGLIAPIIVSTAQNEDTCSQRSCTGSYLDVGGLPLGAIPNAHYHQQSVSIQPGDLIVICSDGIVEAMNPERELYGFTQLLDTISQGRASGMGVEEIVESTLNNVAHFTDGALQHDDMTIVAIERGTA